MEQKLINPVKLNDGSKNYTTFIHSFTTFILQYFESISCSKKEQLSMEQLLTESLLLLEKIHLHIFYSFSIYEKYFKAKSPLNSNINFQLLTKLQTKIKNHCFINEDDKLLCEKIISQILNYYPQSNNKIKIVLSPIRPPWIASL